MSNTFIYFFLKKNSALHSFRVIFVEEPVVSMGWYLRDVHPGKRDVSGSLKRQMAKLIGGMAKKKKR